MSSAAARAEARRKAILSRGSDRLAKLTTSARGEDASAVFHDDPPLAQIPTTRGSTFLGESTADMPMPRPASASPEPSSSSFASPSSQSTSFTSSTSQSTSTSTATATSTSTTTTSGTTNAVGAGARKRGTTPSRNANIFESLGAAGNATDPSVWLPEQQQQFMQALMNAASGAGAGGVGGAGMGPNLSGSGLPGLGAGGMGAGAGGISSPFGEPQDPLMQGGAGEGGAEFNPLAALLGMPQPGSTGGGGGFPPFGAGPGAEGAQFPGMGPMGMMGNMGMMPPEPPKEKTKLQKLMPLLHLVAMWVLLAYFVLWAEPRAFEASVGGGVGGLGEGVGGGTGEGVRGIWERWAELGRGKAGAGVEGVLGRFRVQVVPFFWAFTTLQIILHSLRIFSGFDAVHPPTLLALALPHLPQPFPSLIINGLKYMQMGSLFLDDLAGVVVGLGFVVYFSGWVGGSTGS